MHFQRDALTDALSEVHRHEPGSALSQLWRVIGKKEWGHWVVNLKSASRAALHQGTTKLNTKKGSVGSVEDCYAFVPYETPEGSELNIMEVQGIAVAVWYEEQEAEHDPVMDHNFANANDPIEGYIDAVQDVNPPQVPDPAGESLEPKLQPP
jgi:hypothetical protein